MDDAPIPRELLTDIFYSQQLAPMSANQSFPGCTRLSSGTSDPARGGSAVFGFNAIFLSIAPGLTSRSASLSSQNHFIT